MDANRLRRVFTDYFLEHDHVALPSAGLIPHHARAPLFTNAGMNQFIPYFLGEEIPAYKRATTIQKCVRIRGKHDDIDLIGRTGRHLTFFEMLGNFSFGDYFKSEAIAFAWELLTERLGLDAERLWATVYSQDDEAAAIWQDEVGLPAQRVQRMGEDNFWEMGDTGPCGPCSEIYYDRGPSRGAGGGPAGGSEERFVEIWNLVFTQYDRQADGSLEALPRPNIDTGAGLERILAVVGDLGSIWDTDVLRPVIAAAEEVTGRSYGADPEVDVVLRILADHARSVSFLVSDGVFPSNEDRGYVLRRLLRRAVRHAYQLGVETAVWPPLVAAVVEVMREAYPELAHNADFVTGVVEREEGRFRATLRSGLSMLDAAVQAGAGGISGDVAFRLHDTHGFPIELTREIAAERGVGVDEVGFSSAMAEQRRRSQEMGKTRSAADGDRLGPYRDLLARHGPTRFVGYTESFANAVVLSVLDAGEGRIEVFLDLTPFYAEGGGQVGDTGVIETDTGRARVIDTTAPLPGLHRHLAELEAGELRPGQVATAMIDENRRDAIRRNHTGTHLLHWALREVLGPHVKQQGSLVAPDRLRFDFTHYGPLSAEETVRIEEVVNARILDDEAVSVVEMSKAEADTAGAIAFFEDKYGERVRVVRAGERSTELCGGTHVSRLGQIGAFEIVSEGSIGSNLRRVEATTGTATLQRLRTTRQVIAEAAEALRARPEELVAAIERRLGDIRALESELRAVRQRALGGMAAEISAGAVRSPVLAQGLSAQRSDGGGLVVVARRDGLAPEQLRELAGAVLRSAGASAVVLGGSPDGSKASLVALMAKGQALGAPELIADAARTVGGGGGGRNPEAAMAGGRDASRLDEALRQVRARLGLPA